MFILYSERDFVWVKYELIFNLEKEDGFVLICFYEGNFDFGNSIIENIINYIEKSYKIILVLFLDFV